MILNSFVGCTKLQSTNCLRDFRRYIIVPSVHPIPYYSSFQTTAPTCAATKHPLTTSPTLLPLLLTTTPLSHSSSIILSIPFPSRDHHLSPSLSPPVPCSPHPVSYPLLLPRLKSDCDTIMCAQSRFQWLVDYSFIQSNTSVHLQIILGSAIP